MKAFAKSLRQSNEDFKNTKTNIDHRVDERSRSVFYNKNSRSIFFDTNTHKIPVRKKRV